MLHLCSRTGTQMSRLTNASRIIASAPCTLVAPRPARQHQQGGRRALAVRASQDKQPGEKTWGEILQDAAGVAKSVVKKVQETASSVLAPAKSDDSTSKPAAPQRGSQQIQQSLNNENLGLLPTLMGKAVGGLVSSMVSGLAKQMQEVQREQEGVYADAVSRIRGSAKLRDRMGEVRVGPVTSQSSSSMNINGAVTKSVVLAIPVFGANGEQGMAQVQHSDGPQGRTMRIEVQTQGGDIITVEGAGSGSTARRGQVIDVEYREIK